MATPLRQPLLERLDHKAPKRANSRIYRWVIPIGGGVIAAILIVVATPHVAWFLRGFLAVIAFLYLAGQSASYLWSSSDQGE